MADGGRGCTGIAGLCRQYVQKKLEAEKTFSVESLLKDRELAQACYMAHFFALVGKDRTYILHELKDKEYVLWLLNHPEVFEKLSFAKASGKDTLAVLRNIWLKEGRNFPGLALTWHWGRRWFLHLGSRRHAKRGMIFTKSLLWRKNCFRSSLRWSRGNSGFFSGGRKVLRNLPGRRII